MDYTDILYTQEVNPLTFNFENLMAPYLNYFIPQSAIIEIHNIVISLKYAAKVTKKYKMIQDIMGRYGWVKYHCGTNRMVFRHRNFPMYLIKVAIDKVGLDDSLNEFINQNMLKPFVTKIYEVTRLGTMALVERVEPILNEQEFYDIRYEVFDLLTKVIIGEYILEDIGSKHFMNYGIRPGFGVVILDFPYLFKLDQSKLYCQNNVNGYICDGEIDFDDGFNDILCTKCGKKYIGQELKKMIEIEEIKIEKSENYKSKVKVSVFKGGKLVKKIGMIDTDYLV